MGKRNAAALAQSISNGNDGPSIKKAKYNNINHQQQQQRHSHLNYNMNNVSSDDDYNNEELTSNVVNQSPKPEFHLSRELVNGIVLTDLTQKQWRIGNPIGKGSFGEIFLASDNISSPVTDENAKYVVKIEPHSNGPLFVEIHCLLNTAKVTEDNLLPPGMPAYIASGSHYFNKTRYRFLILQRFNRELNSIIKNRKVDPKSVLIIAVQVLNVLEHIHDKGYCHSDIKAENLMISKCTYHKEQLKQSCEIIRNEILHHSERQQEINMNAISFCNNYNKTLEFNSNASNNSRRRNLVQFGGSNPIRSCRVKNYNKPSSTIYQDMVTTHYLRPAKKINYSEYFVDDTSKDSSSNDDDTIDDYMSRRKFKLNKYKKLISRAETTNENNEGYRKELNSSSSHVITTLQEQSIMNNSTSSFYKNLDENWVTEDRIFLIDFGLASKFIDTNGIHHPFCMDQRRAHDGTLEFTSRDAHMGAHSRRSDLECLGYNLILWSQGRLPWKEYAAQQQRETVHRMKEFLMSDVKQTLKHVYGKTCPKYLSEYMQYVGQLSYHERPNYKKCKDIFVQEYVRLGYNKNKMILDINELIQNSIDVTEEIENNNLFEMKNTKVMKKLGLIIPFKESNSSNRVSPKNLRSKSDKLSSTKKRKNFSWAEILNKDPDRIARERANKEFDREDNIDDTPKRYQGNPTYAIVEIQNRIKFKDRMQVTDVSSSDIFNDSDLHLKGYTKPMIDILKKRCSNVTNNTSTLYSEKTSTPSVQEELQHNNFHREQQSRYKRNIFPSSTIKSEKISTNAVSNHFDHGNSNELRNKIMTPIKPMKFTRHRTKAGLRTVITPTTRGLDYSHSLIKRRTKCTSNIVSKNLRGYNADVDDDDDDDDKNSSCSSNNSLNSIASSSIISSNCNNVNNKKSSESSSSRNSSSTSSSLQGGAGSSTSTVTSLSCAPVGISDEDDSHDMQIFSSVADNHNDLSKRRNLHLKYGKTTTNKRTLPNSTNKTTNYNNYERKNSAVCNVSNGYGGRAVGGKLQNIAAAEKITTETNGRKKSKNQKKKKTPKKKETKRNKKKIVVDEDYNTDNNSDNYIGDDDDLSGYEYYPAIEQHHHEKKIKKPVATFKKRTKRTRSG